MKNPQRPTTLSIVRCAIYTRKSTEEGLEQEFNSLDAQREAGQAYIQSQQQEGWTCLPGRVPRVAKLLALAHRFEALLREGVVQGYAELGRLGRVTPARVS